MTRHRLLALAALGLVVFTFPFLGLFNRPVLVLGVPLLFGYLFAAWALLIGAMGLAIGADRPAGRSR